MMLEDKVAVVTGAANGIGEGIARLFAAQGAHLVLLDRDASANIRLGAELNAEAHTVDVADRMSLKTAFDATLDRFQRVDILINNAGIYPRRLFMEMTEVEWDRMHDINLKSLFHTIQLAAPTMLRQRSGKIVNISSVTFHLGTANLSHYVAAKGGVIGLTRSLAREFGPSNVHVNCVTPGAIQTESEKNFVTPEQAAAMVDQQSLKRRLKPLDIARTALFLASELSDGLTGQTVNVDGGWHMH